MKRFIASIFNRLPKRLLALAIVGMAVALPVSALAADTVRLEGSIGVANVTNGDTQYQHEVNASYDQVVKVQVFYHNTEAPDSGKVAQNLRVKINMPTAPGQTQLISETTSADNASNTIQDQATVHLDRTDATLDYIPGSAVWRHDIGTNAAPNYVEEKISDNIVTNGQGMVLENEQPCFNFAATVTVLARVHIPGVKIIKQVEKADQTNAWATTNAANPGDTLKYLITYQNTGNTTQNQVIIRDNLPPKMTLVPGTTMLADAANPSGVKVSDSVTQGGINAGNFAPGANAFVTFQVKVPTADQLECGQTEFRNVGVAHPEGMNEFENTATTDVNKVCQTQITPTCDALEITPGSNRTVTVSKFQETPNGATFNNVVINWGDASTPLTTNNAVGQTHQYTGDGPFTIVATAHFTVPGQSGDVTASGASCSKPVSFTPAGTPVTLISTTPPTQLVNTGAGSTIGLFAGATIVGTVAYRLYLSRRLVRG